MSLTEERELTKSENLTEQLIDLIVKGEFAAGSKISEPELARRFGVSRGPLREAIMRVESLGLIERAPHVGARVIALSRARLVEIYAVREALEGMAVRLACEHITDQELEALQQLLDTHGQHIEEVEGASYFHQQGDFDFHYRIIQASRNGTLIGLLCDELYHLLRMYRHQSQRSHSRPQQALAEHYHLLSALRERDAELAELLMRRHIMRSRQLIAQQLNDEQGESV
ncbi:GntR family transcriptional regulator [Oceanimonas pelagia]|uniref:GntR family transcriptional regulator n=1 Tax=Oceanimonas pelagia TaxID=3028314 RepID=A0AA50KSE2_9GAMM|nr:GntR family transcriptional regulator [Oceanimonas pelagia]WMC12215.1 GntR family transcriptional regulator [Oceanimonas pelagia]